MGDDAVLDIARLIAGDEPPGWLLYAADKARDMLSESRRGKANYPTRAPQRQQLVTLHAAIAFVRKAMRNPTISGTLLAGDNHFHNQNETDHGLADLAKRAATAIGKIPPGGGRNKFYAQPDGLSPEVKCALMVSVLWTSARGEVIPTSNETAQRACEALWKAASVGESVSVRGAKPKKRNVRVKAAGCGPDRRKAGESVTRWRDHLRAASRAPSSNEAEFVCAALSRSVAIAPVDSSRREAAVAAWRHARRSHEGRGK